MFGAAAQPEAGGSTESFVSSYTYRVLLLPCTFQSRPNTALRVRMQPERGKVSYRLYLEKLANHKCLKEYYVYFQGGLFKTND